MGLKTMSLLAGSTISVSGGSAVPFTDNGVSVPNGVQLVVTSDADFQTRRLVTVKYRPPTINPRTNAYTKDKKSVTYVVPQILADGSVVFNTLRIEREVHPSMSASSCTELNKIGSQLLTDADLDNFWGAGSLS